MESALGWLRQSGAPAKPMIDECSQGEHHAWYAGTQLVGLALRGVFAIIFGVLALIWPRLALFVLIALFGAYALLAPDLRTLPSIKVARRFDSPSGSKVPSRRAERLL